MGDTINSLFSTTILAPLVISFIFSLILGPIFIPILHKLKFGQNIRKEGPKSHQKKAGTPTMGGIIFFISVAATILIMGPSFTDPKMIILYSFLAFGFIGFLDDMLKIIHKDNLGLKAGQKMILLLIFSVALAVYGYKNIGTDILIPLGSGFKLNLGLLYIPFVIIYYAAVTNAVNLTDGIDGLATSVTIIVLTFFTIVAFKTGQKDVAIFSIALCGALLGFLKYNAFPAKIFMGDTGSLALGGAVGTIALMLKMELWVVIVGLMYVVETLSVIIQVTSFKMTGKRVFKMAPIHHHFEQCGWSEVKIVTIFSLVTAVLCIIGFIAI
ncbi:MULTISPECIES: phospho-N-acetylmuramoyl-pentapeptide-transferase [Clostridium]|jgi:phospho-N-acetylmuramoyl-pentapeptide-transferase|uniref:Phospho-N-acetylmuramoyl-pentapeptide-transferase n=1 Tax=Clostridium butyricum TaxID=1492 RepID=A0A3R9DJI8_CLOBU|nr:MULTISPECIES: phospho-N-acetylmuramoyl-pentapeptide-transferase [Clostridium]ETI87821.1 MAG: Phospho-N-acetylmuramoyl-pentapeptide-transferase [Clostridium butyricum DORA_1]ALP90869.1 phospho-N-acetylmuramoyl-pentapeptide-transferase [Clostridium butyricum]ALS17397.1 phospho-N-acetylmuramoyl-pentapeptide-transferase [Clostridium butyricum]ANF14492.1 phospho-N-acetylmuramoyl-pentapeptide-transferase [Clostridium butyricum]AOR94557.1 phospho-N-acetylmuramoyl-pentapeptide-transferase [Clostrid